MTRKLVLAAFTVTIATVTSAAPNASDFTPAVAYSLPVGSAHRDWAGGYNLGLTYDIGREVGGWKLAARLGFSRWTPNDAELLKVGGREFKTEKKEGWLAAGDLSLLARRELLHLPLGRKALSGELGVGVAYLRNSKVTVKGFAPVEGTNTALVKYVFRDATVKVIPAISGTVSVGVSANLHLFFGVSHYLTSGGVTPIGFGISLLPSGEMPN